MSPADNLGNQTKPERFGVDLYQMVYISHICHQALLNTRTLSDITATSIRNNEQNGITGILCYGNGCFFQCVEGSEEALTNLKNTLIMDDRHQDMSILDFSKISQRSFSDWSMQAIVLENWLIHNAKVKPLLPFEPFQWQGNDWQKFFELLKGYYRSEAAVIQKAPENVETLGVRLSKVIGQHQAFFFIQAVIGLLLALSIIMIIIVSSST